jgi:hypothetical protein
MADEMSEREELKAILDPDPEDEADKFWRHEMAEAIIAAGWMKRPEPGSAEFEAMVERAARAMGDDYPCGFDGLPEAADQPKRAVPHTHGMTREVLREHAEIALRAACTARCNKEHAP